MTKQFTLRVVFLLWLPLLNAQTLDSAPDSSNQQAYESFMRIKRTNNTAGWIMLGAGSAMVIGGILINLSGGFIDNDTSNNSKGLWLSYLGGATTLASIPLFIAAGKNKKRAELALKQEVSASFNTFNTRQIALSLKIDLN